MLQRPAAQLLDILGSRILQMSFASSSPRRFSARHNYSRWVRHKVSAELAIRDHARAFLLSRLSSAG